MRESNGSTSEPRLNDLHLLYYVKIPYILICQFCPLSPLWMFMSHFSKGKPKGQQPQETGDDDLENTEVAWLSTSMQRGSTNSCPGVWEAKNNITQYN